MSHCCGNHSKSEERNRMSFGERPPKSFIGKFLYNLGKKENEKESQKKQQERNPAG